VSLYRASVAVKASQVTAVKPVPLTCQHESGDSAETAGTAAPDDETGHDDLPRILHAAGSRAAATDERRLCRRHGELLRLQRSCGS